MRRTAAPTARLRGRHQYQVTSQLNRDILLLYVGRGGGGGGKGKERGDGDGEKGGHGGIGCFLLFGAVGPDEGL